VPRRLAVSRGTELHTTSHTEDTLRRPAVELVYQTLSDRITRWQLPAGERLTEERMCREFGLSRTPVREALRRLEEAGLVERVEPRGYAVRGFDLDQLDKTYTVRCALEELAVSLAAPAVDTPAFAELRAQASASLEGTERGDLAGEIRERFHEQLARLGGNEPLMRMLEDIDRRIYACRRLDAIVPERAVEAQREHLGILDHLAAGEVEEARALMRRHVERSQSTIRSLMAAGVTAISFAADPVESAP
jgi:DNA-binding GntR family transcriptional regulator